MDIRGKFTEHPASVGETYTEHMRVAASYSGRLFKASMCAAIHALFPWKHCTTASATIRTMHDEMQAGHRGDFAEVA